MNTLRTINPVQLHLLEMFNYCGSEQTVSEMKDVLSDFYARKVQEEADRLWDEGKLNAEAIETILQEHWRMMTTSSLIVRSVDRLNSLSRMIGISQPCETWNFHP